MKVLILAGGLGSRLSEETVLKPKPMVEIAGKPILWHILKIYSHYGFNDFVILLGYKGYLIKEYFSNYFLHTSDITIDISENSIEVHNKYSEPWKITLIDTGLNSMTGGRVKKAKDYINNQTFMLTYGDGLANINIKKLLSFHRKHGKECTMSTVQPEGRWGDVKIDKNSKINSFIEKPKGDGSWINGGYFVCEPSVLDYINGDDTIFEKKPLENLAKNGQLYSYQHNGFWKAMDTLRDKNDLENLYVNEKAPWKKW